MGRQSKANIRAYFETGDRPTQQQFEDFIDSVAWGNGTALGVVEIESTNSSTILSRGSFGAVWLGAASTASALGHLGITSVGAVGNQLLSTIATASALNQLGITSVGAVGNQLLSTIATASALGQLGITSVGAVGNQLLGAIATASAINHLGAGTVGVQLLSAIATASAQNQLALGTGNTPTFTGLSLSGALTLANQPSFLAYNSADDANQTGNGATATVDFDAEVFDQTSNFASDTFTAPTTGRYLLSATVNLANFGAGANTANLIIATSNRSYRHQKYTLPTSNTGDSVTLTVVADMDAADTATVTIQVAGMAGDTVTIKSGAAPLNTMFSGQLIA